MELVAAPLFIGTAIIAVTQFIKLLVPNVNGAVTIAVAALLGLLVALIDVHIGVVDISPAVGILTGLGSSGIITFAEKV